MKLVVKILGSLVLASTLVSAVTVVTVNGKKISSEEIDNNLMQMTQGQVAQMPVAKQNELRARLVDGMVADELIFEDAKKRGMLKTKEYKKAYDEVINRVKKQIATQLWQKKEFEKVKVSKKEVKAYYNANKAEFKQKQSANARHIIVKTEKEAEAIIKQMKGLKGKALEKKFVELVQKESTGPSAANGGNLGWFQNGQMAPEFWAASINLKKGTITQNPVKTQFGYHVIFLIDKKKAQTVPFKEVSKFIEERLKMQGFQKDMEKTLKKLRDKAKIVYAK
ncbi:MAG: peptidyl-prolyl cis-trans isomerase [Campylobacterota bacterium]|nr:peptidyl-prolyl cis-trans isomerase [Campylobacterota bacterium]